MNIGLVDVDSKIPNLALMKLSMFHKLKGDDVTFYSPFFKYYKIYASKVFSYTPEYQYIYDKKAVFGGSGYNYNNLSSKIEHIVPDYGLYPNINYSMGFVTRGCIRKCKFCIVPKKEGSITAHAEIDEFVRHSRVILLDNNILASGHGIKQLELLRDRKIKIDCNQGLDARLIDNKIAKLLSQIKWIRFIRMACDSTAQISSIKKAVNNLANNGVKPYRIMCYALIDDPKESIERIQELRELNIDIFGMPLRDLVTGESGSVQKKIGRWVNHKAIFKTVKNFDEYK